MSAPSVIRSAGTRSVTGRSHGAGLLRRILLPSAVVLILLILLELVSRTGLVDRTFFPPASEVLSRLAWLLTRGSVWADTGRTVAQAGLGLLLAAAVGIPLGLLTGLVRLADDLTAWPVELLRPVPSVALIPLLILILGTGPALAVALATVASLWPILVQTRAGLRAVDPTALDTGLVYGLTRLGRLRWIVLPSAAPHIVTGLRIAASLAVILAVTSQLVAGAPGLGRSLSLAQSAGDPTTTYAYIVLTGLLGLAALVGLSLIERSVLSVHGATGGGAS